MNKFSAVIGCLLVAATYVCAAATSSDAAPDNDVLPAASAAQMLALADKALSAGQLSQEERARNLVRRGLAHEILGDRKNALTDFNEAIAGQALSTAEQADALYDRGITLDELGRTDEAVADYTAALRLRPDFAAALNNRGNAFRRLGRLSDARTDYEQSMRSGNPNPEYPDYGMGQIAEALGQPAAAVEYYRSALAANPQFTLAEDRLVAMDAGGLGITAAVDAAPARAARHGRRLKDKPAQVADVDAAPLLKPTISDAAAPTGGRSVQLGAYRSEAEANDAWDRAQKRSGQLLAGRTASIIRVDLPVKGRYYRLRVSRLAAAEAAQLCASLKARGTGCILPPD
jgi:tetratricopeptide (TPR) repeat protein